jgi:hypothetical protein
MRNRPKIQTAKSLHDVHQGSLLGGVQVLDFSNNSEMVSSYGSQDEVETKKGQKDFEQWYLRSL